MNPNWKAILLMGGKGTRFNSVLPKQFHFLAGKKIYEHTLERFLASGLFSEIILVCASEWIEQVQKEITSPHVRVVAGGETRQESSYLGLLACGSSTEYVMIHDAVRPFVSFEILKNNAIECQKYHAIDTCIPSADTIVFAPSLEQIEKIPPRAHYLRGQTPQSFAYPLILEAHLAAQKKGVSSTDDCTLVLSLGKPVHLVQGDESNIKITTDLDLYLAEQLFRKQPPHNLSLSARSFDGKLFAITGGTGEIGQAIAHQLEKRGAKTLLLSRSSQEYPVDLTVPEAAEKVFQKIGPIDGLINCIGLFHVKEISHLSAQDIQTLIATNLTAVIFSCKFAQVASGGDILNVASSSYSRGRKGSSLYSASKAALVNFTQALAEERPDLRVHTLAPQRTNTHMRRSHFPFENPSSLLSPDTVAQEALALLSGHNLTGLLTEVRR
jgi:2-C-methyl-D-erythritol 4-phosphate cytidylyltransferase